MKCPTCHTLISTATAKVVDKRMAESSDAIRRRRECKTCGTRFTTMEAIVRTELPEDLREMVVGHA